MWLHQTQLLDKNSKIIASYSNDINVTHLKCIQITFNHYSHLLRIAVNPCPKYFFGGRNEVQKI